VPEKIRFFELSMGGDTVLVSTAEQVMIYLGEIELTDIVVIRARELNQEEYDAIPDFEFEEGEEDGSPV